MENALFHAHSGIRYLIFLVLLVLLAKSAFNVLGKRNWGKTERLTSTILLALTHTQVLLGLVMYFFVHKYHLLVGDMSNPDSRWKSVEHLTAMLVFALLITLLHMGNKKPQAKNPHRRALLLGGIALALALAGIPMDRWF
jgi:heme/copper-type cytochrome/quinol oxidase subunit 4